MQHRRLRRARGAGDGVSAPAAQSAARHRQCLSKLEPPSAADLARLLPFTDILHIKDYANAARRFVAVGEGDIPLATLLAATLPGREAPLTLTIETHASSEPAATTRRSVNGLRRTVDSIGLA